jgi:hypothetical protein
MKNKTKQIIPIKIGIIVIPIIIILYLINVNYLFDQEITYHYDIGSKDDNYLYPSDRTSNKIEENEVNYRTISEGLVYFYNNYLPPGTKTIEVTIRFKNNFPESGKLSLGAKNNDGWGYTSNKIFENTEENNDEWITKKFIYDFETDKLERGEKGDYFFVLRTPHLGQEEYKNYTIPIDYINITIYKPGLL